MLQNETLRIEGDGNLKEKAANLKAFVDSNDDPAHSANLKSLHDDRIEAIVDLLDQICVQRQYMDCHEFLLLLLNALKIMCRKECNRSILSSRVLNLILNLIDDHTADDEILRQCANVLLNACHSEAFVQRLIEAKRTTTLIRLLESKNDCIAYAAAGAMKNITYHEGGPRIALPAIAAIVALLGPDRPRNARGRAIGIVHNITIDAEATRLVQRHHALPLIVELLKAEYDLDTRASAAGAIQNVANDTSTRWIINDLGAIDLLSELVVSAHPVAQANAIGALWNLVQPNLAEGVIDAQVYKSALSGSIAAAIMLNLDAE